MSLQHILSTDNLSILIHLVFYTSSFLTISALALFIEAAIVLRTVVLSRSSLARYALPGLPLGASILCYIVAMAGWQGYYDWRNSMGNTHITLYIWNEMIFRFNFLSISIIGLVQSALAVALFVLTLFLEKRLLPRINQRPLWTMVRRQRVI